SDPRRSCGQVTPSGESTMNRSVGRKLAVLSVVAVAAFCLGAAAEDSVVNGNLRILGTGPNPKPGISLEQTGNASVGGNLEVKGSLKVKDKDVGAKVTQLEGDVKALSDKQQSACPCLKADRFYVVLYSQNVRARML